MKRIPYRSLLAAGLAVSCLLAQPAHAHAVAGDRVFPATMAVDDPGVGDELDLQFSHIKVPNGDGTDSNVNTTSAEWDKLITPNFALSLGGTYVNQNSGETTQGFDNATIGAKYQLYVNPAHEFMTSIGLKADLGDTGSKAIANSYSTISPAVFFGKGFGDLPDSLSYLKPLALTSLISPNISTNRNQSDSVDWGFTLQYSLPYLQTHVKDLGLSEPFSQLVPVIEFPMNTCTSGDCAGQTTGTINPGLLWVGHTMQLGLEAQIPVNHATGSHTGVQLQVHFFLDDIFPHSIGAPLFK